MLAIFLAIICARANGANWAQASGNIQQNTVIPYIPSPGTQHWAARYGMAVIAQVLSNQTATEQAIYILGGDTYTGDNTQRDYQPGLQDYYWENGFKNDVWQFTGTEWAMKGDSRLRTKYKQKIPRIQANVEWKLVQPGNHPPPGVTNDHWLQCGAESGKIFISKHKTNCTAVDTSSQVQWSPRRHHAGVLFKGSLWILGGRAREFVEFSENRTVGGIMGPRIQNVPSVYEQDGQISQKFTSQREAIVLKSDVWRSDDHGINWVLVTPGCRVQQDTLIAEGNEHEGAHGVKSAACEVDSDCYGVEKCHTEWKTCYCKDYWSPREQHAVAADKNYIYLSGGYASALYSRFSSCGKYACGDTDASSYRYYLSDVWRSADGEIWELLTGDAFKPTFPGAMSLGRGGHQMIIVNDANGTKPYLWVFGGRGGDNSYRGGPQVYFNDIWAASLEFSYPSVWFQVFPGVRVGNDSIDGTMFDFTPGNDSEELQMPWSPRTGHQVVLQEVSVTHPHRTIYISGGYNNGTFLDDLWSWRPDVPGDVWRKDFTSDALFNWKVGDEYVYRNNSPTVAYVTVDSDLSMMQRFWVPTKPDSVYGSTLTQRPYLSQEKIAMLNSVGIRTIKELAEIPLYTVLKLRGFDYPQVPKEKRMNFKDVCDYRALAIELVKKCQINIPNLYDGEKNMPWNVIPVFGGPPPETDTVKWHNRDNYDFLLAGVDDPVVLTESWDGCTYIPQIEGLFGPNVNGLGYVDQVTIINDPTPTLQELFCKQEPGPRAYHAMAVIEERLYVMGGKKDESEFYADTWYRDDRVPIATISKAPPSKSSAEWFMFSADKQSVFFEYRVWDPYNYKEIRPWTEVTKKTSIAWLNWRESGPGNGYYQLYVRAVDQAGNRDERYIMGKNVYQWYYVSPTPWDIIAEVICGVFGLCVIAYMEYRRRVKKAAMERYAMKRMRRKFKAMQRDINGKAVDWRTLYTENKQLEEAGLKKTAKKKKKERDKNAEKREKEKKKREKEKEMIKKKLKASKDFKEKNAVALPPPAGAKSTRKVAAIELEDEDDAMGDIEAGLSTKAPDKGKSGVKKSKVAPGGDDASEDALAKGDVKAKSKGVKIESSTKELGAGDLKASKDTEMGTKQRKVNKRFKSYEEVDPNAIKNSLPADAGGGGGGDEEEKDVEHKKDL